MSAGNSQPLEGVVGFSAKGIDFGNLIGGLLAVVVDKLLQGCVRFLLFTQSTVSQGLATECSLLGRFFSNSASACCAFPCSR